jgi:endonuclease YncB( thermonuclease family)
MVAVGAAVIAGVVVGWFALLRNPTIQTPGAASPGVAKPAVQTVIMKGSGTGPGTWLAPSQVHVIGGDTIRVVGAPDYRLVGCDAPQTLRAQCQSERTLGERAANRLKAIVAGGGITLERVACACPPGTDGQPSCNQGQRCGIVRAQGRNVCETLVAEGLARPLLCGQTRCPPRQGWC